MRTKAFLLFLIIIGLFYRVYGLNANHSFWTDENHLAIFARAILERGRPVLINGYSTGVYQWLQYWLSAISAKTFGLNEFAIRFPSVIFGVLTIWVVYLVGKELFSKNVGLVAAALTTFLKIEILWSRQARPYQALQFFYLLGAWFLYKLSKKDKFEWKYFAGFLACGILASVMHGLGLVIFFVGFLYLLLFRFFWFKKKWTVLGLAIPLIFSYIFRVQILAIVSQIGKTNNLFYYRVFLWHNYSLLVFLVLVGFLSLVLQKKNSWQIPVLFLVVQGIIVSFFLGQPFTRYFYIVFPFLILLSAFGLWQTSKYLGSLIKRPKYLIAHFVGFLRNASIQYLILFALVFSVVTFGHKFAFLPQPVYSLNEDMQEIPEVDYQKIYALIEKKLEANPQAVFISNWNDHPIWYLGEGQPKYLLRKQGVSPFSKDEVSGAIYIQNLEEFSQVIKSASQGIILLDSWDDVIPQDAREYIRANLKKEFEIDRLYPVQPRLWPVEVYSWGMDKN